MPAHIHRHAIATCIEDPSERGVRTPLIRGVAPQPDRVLPSGVRTRRRHQPTNSPWPELRFRALGIHPFHTETPPMITKIVLGLQTLSILAVVLAG